MRSLPYRFTREGGYLKFRPGLRNGKSFVAFSRWELELLGQRNSGTLSETKGAALCSFRKISGRGMHLSRMLA